MSRLWSLLEAGQDGELSSAAPKARNAEKCAGDPGSAFEAGILDPLAVAAGSRGRRSLSAHRCS